MAFSTIGGASTGGSAETPSGGAGSSGHEGVDDQSSSNDDQITIKDTEVVINEDGDATMDFRVEGDALTHLLFVDSSADKVGINTSTPESLLEINAGSANNIEAFSITEFDGNNRLAIEADFVTNGNPAILKSDVANPIGKIFCTVGRVEAHKSALVKARAQAVLNGSIDPAASTTVTGVETQFLSQVAIGDSILVTGETRVVTAIASDTSLTVSAAFSDNSNDTSPEVLPCSLTVQQSDGSLALAVNSTGLTLGTAAPLIAVDTGDAGDNKSLTLCGGGAGSITRGPYIFLGGNEHATGGNKGTIKLACGVGDNGSNVGDLYVYQGSSGNNRLLIDQSETVFNEDSIDADFRVESNGSANMLFVDGGNNRVGVNSGSPTEALDVDGVVALKSQDSSPSTSTDYAKLFSLGTGVADNSNTVLLLHLNGGDGDAAVTDIIDTSPTPLVPSAVGGTAQLDQAQKKFGNASLKFDGDSDYLQYADNTAWDFGTGDFTIDTWFRMDDVSGGEHGFISTTGGLDGFWKLSYDGSAQTWKWWTRHSHTAVADTGVLDDTWHHVAVAREGTTIKIFRDGLEKGSFTAVRDDLDDGSINIGIQENTGGLFFGAGNDGWMDDFRIVKGEALWTAAFNTSSFITSPAPAATTFSGAEMHVQDSSGNETKLSSHTPEGEWEYLSRNKRTGKTVRINMEEVVRDLGKLTGKNYIKDE